MSAEVEHSYRVMNLAGDIQKLMVDMETGQRGFRVTGEKQFLLPYFEALKDISNKINELKALVSDNLRQRNNAATLEWCVGQLLQFWKYNGAYNIARQPQLISEITNQEKKQMDEIRNSVGALLLIENSLLSQRKAVNNNMIAFNSHVSIAGIILIEAIIFSLVTLTVRELNKNQVANKKLLYSNTELEDNKAELVNTWEILLKSEMRLKQAQAIAHLGSWEYDLYTDIATLSEEACRIYGLSPDENKQSFRSWRSFIHPDDVNFVLRSLNKANKMHSDSAFQYRIIQKGGEVRYIYFHGVYDIGNGGDIKSIYGVTQDISEIKQLELETLQLVKSLQKKNEDLKLFTYMISHNLRASVAKILGLVNLLKDETRDEKLNMDLVEYIKNETVSLDAVVREINAVITAGSLN